MPHDFQTFGVEQEHFIFHGSGRVPAHDEVERVYEILRAGHWSLIRRDDGRTLAAKLDTVHGEVVVSNDFATHIFEMAFPPMVDVDGFVALYLSVFETVVDALKALGLAIQNGGCLSQPPAKMLLRGNLSDASCLRMQKLLRREPTGGKLFIPEMPGMVCSTQVSMDRPKDVESYAFSIAKFEFLAPLLFSNSKGFLQSEANCIRPLAIFDNLKCIDESHRLISPSDDVYRYPLIKMHANRIEFRSACSQPDVFKIVELIQFRQSQCRSAFCSNSEPISLTESFGFFMKGCQGRLNNEMQAIAGEIQHSHASVVSVLLDRRGIHVDDPTC